MEVWVELTLSWRVVMKRTCSRGTETANVKEEEWFLNLKTAQSQSE